MNNRIVFRVQSSALVAFFAQDQVVFDALYSRNTARCIGCKLDLVTSRHRPVERDGSIPGQNGDPGSSETFVLVNACRTFMASWRFCARIAFLGCCEELSTVPESVWALAFPVAKRAATARQQTQDYVAGARGPGGIVSTGTKKLQSK